MHHFLHNKLSCCEVAGYIQILWLSKHDSRHKLINPAAKIPESGVMLVCVSGIGHICTILDRTDQPVSLTGWCLSVIIQADHDIPADMVEPCHQGRMLPKILCQTDPGNSLIFPA